MKVIIVGAGLGGLSTAIALRKYKPASQPLAINIYDNTDPEPGQAATEHTGPQVSTSRLGAGLGLQAKGLHVLQDLDPALRRRVYATGFPCTHFAWKTAGNWLLGREYADVLPISRPLLINCLQEALPPGSVVYKKVSRVVVQQGKKPVVQFEDGSPDETADLVIGADGIRSTVRQDLFGDDDKYQPQYTGLCAVGGVLDIPLPAHLLRNPGMIFLIGSTGVFGYTGLTQANPNKLLYWSVYETELPGRGPKLEHSKILAQLRARHGGWADPLVRQCLARADLDNLYPVFVTPELPAWGRDGCVLIGDAAHALPPRSGQGASQAFEDAQALALLLAGCAERYGAEEPEAAVVARAIRGLHETRARRVEGIRAEALRWKDPKMPMSWFRTAVMYVALFVIVRTRAIARMFGRSDNTWSVKEEVRRYLAR
ncbi:hypothetical protein AAE478_000051 [Parahypoxylon ruwenzoriense]